MPYKIIGIIGGMGPLAAVDFEKKLLILAGGASDQDYPVIINYNNSRIPDRTHALLDRGSNPVSELVATAKKLTNAGAEVLVMPCNTAHAFFEEVQSRIDAPMVNIIHAVVNRIKTKYPGVSQVGMLATTGTIKSGVYEKILKESGFELIHISEKEQETFVMEAIYGDRGIKAGFTDGPHKLLEQASGILCEQGAEVIIMGCTEIPLVLKHARVPLVDSSFVLAEEVLRQAMVCEDYDIDPMFRVR